MNHPAPELRAILFDLDGTLVDTVGLVVDAIAKTVKEHGFKPDMKAIYAGLGQPVFNTLADFLPADKVDEVARDYLHYYNTEAVKQTKLFPGVLEGLKILKERYLLGIVTGKLEEGANISLEAAGIHDLFDVIVGGDTAERGKPYPDPVHYALDSLGVKADEALFVGDALHDIHAGKNAGVKSIAVLTGSGTREEFEGLADEIYETIDAFFNALLKI